MSLREAFSNEYVNPIQVQQGGLIRTTLMHGSGRLLSSGMSESAGVRAGFDDVAAAVVEAIRLLDPELAGKSADRVPEKRTKVRRRLRVMIDTEIDLASPENVCGWILRRGRPSRADDDRPSYRTR